MAEEWKKALSLYVNEYNQDEVDYRARTENTMITDLEYLMHRSLHKRKLEEWYKERGAVPLRSETRARLLREIENREGEMEVEMLLAQKMDYEKGAPATGRSVLTSSV